VGTNVVLLKKGPINWADPWPLRCPPAASSAPSAPILHLSEPLRILDLSQYMPVTSLVCVEEILVAVAKEYSSPDLAG
jgi:hypothetical protein